MPQTPNLAVANLPPSATNQPKPPSPNPRRVAAGKRNWLKRGPWTEESKAKLRAAALKNQPWKHSTGPKTLEGKQRSANNGRYRQKRQQSVRAIHREMQGEMATVQSLLAAMKGSRRLATAEPLPDILARAALPDILSGAVFGADIPHSEASAVG